jgi:hypothetical protein
VAGSGIITGNLRADGDYEGLPKSIIIENPNGAENLSFFYTPVDETIQTIIPTISGENQGSGITWEMRYAENRADHDTAATVIAGGTDTHLGNTGNPINTFDNPMIPANSHVWIETSSVSGTVNYLSLTVLL